MPRARKRAKINADSATEARSESPSGSETPPRELRIVSMRHAMMMMLGLLGMIAAGCEKTSGPAVKTEADSKAQTAAQTQLPGEARAGDRSGAATAPDAPVEATNKKLFMDVHDLGRGKVTVGDVVAAHQKDLAMESKYGVEYKAFWVDEKAGKIYCLAEGPSAEAVNVVHREAHGLLANEIREVLADSAHWTPTPGKKLFMDVHHFGTGKVTAADVAEAHKKDLSVAERHGVKYLNYWLDTRTGTVMCLSEAPNARAALAVHEEAHGLMPDSIEEVFEGR